MAASDYVPIFFKNRLHLAGRPQMSTRPNKYQGKQPKAEADGRHWQRVIVCKAAALTGCSLDERLPSENGAKLD